MGTNFLHIYWCSEQIGPPLLVTAGCYWSYLCNMDFWWLLDDDI